MGLSGTRLRVVTGVAMLTTLAACSKSTPSTSSSPSSGAPACSGKVAVLYAASLTNLMNNQIGPAFQADTGCTFNGTPAGSSALANGIKSGVYQGDVFISAAAAPNLALQGDSNGSWETWYATFASSGLVLGYNVSSTFAAALTTQPWYSVVTQTGFRLGRTDPKTDPKGVLAAQAITETAAAQNLPALTNLLSTTGNVFDETSLVAQIQTKNLDGAFFYTIEAQAAGIPTVPLAAPADNLNATYTITILNKAPNMTGAEAFVNYLLGAKGKVFLTNDKFTLKSPVSVTGTGVPAGVSSVIP